MGRIRVAAFLAAWLLAAGARAATLDLASGGLTYTAATGAVNALTVSLSAGTYTIDDPGESAVTLSAGASAAGCASLDANTVTCPRAAISSWNVQLGDQNDTASLAAVLEPTTIRGGTGNDTITGGAGADNFLWNPGDASDFVDGGPGADTFSFTAANINESLAVSAIPNGFQLTRDIANVVLQVVNVEALNMQALGGDDTVTTHPLANTSQTIDGGAQTASDTLNYDAGGVCTTQGTGSFQTLGAQPVTFTGFEAVNLQNECTVFPVAIDVSAGVLTYSAGTGDVNALTVSLAGGNYTIHDAGTPAITLGSAATTAGCFN
ncbi:MAG TPA: hypothetical protein VLV15_07280, partial [Dongiaceae bacterium]|nr:hypothetical protein [Dongiaceae bacterium]